jgi:hypothetical protein
MLSDFFQVILLPDFDNNSRIKPFSKSDHSKNIDMVNFASLKLVKTIYPTLTYAKT